MRVKGYDIFTGADLRGADLRGTNLQGTNLRWANIQEANIQGANLQGANLQWADLRGADLRGADLRWSNLMGTDTIVISGLRWDVIKYPTDMQIGCERHTYEQWSSFSDDEIHKMDPNALQFWKTNKAFLLTPHNNQTRDPQ